MESLEEVPGSEAALSDLRPSSSYFFFFSSPSAIINQWHQEPKDKVVSLLLSHLPLLQPGNADAKSEYMKLLQKVLAYSIESNLFIEESRQLLSYALIHPATTLDDRSSLALWLNHLEERLSSGYPSQGRARPDTAYHSRQGSDDWQGPGETGLGDLGHGWQEKAPRENGHMSFHPAGSVSSGINSIGSSTGSTGSEGLCWGKGWKRGRGEAGIFVRSWKRFSYSQIETGFSVRCVQILACELGNLHLGDS